MVSTPSPCIQRSPEVKTTCGRSITTGMKKSTKKQFYLVHNVDGVSLEMAGGPFHTDGEREEALIHLVSATSGLKADGADTVHALDIVRGKPVLADYAGGYIENIRWVADGCKEDEQPSTWNTPGFALITRKKVEKRRAIV